MGKKSLQNLALLQLPIFIILKIVLKEYTLAKIYYPIIGTSLKTVFQKAITIQSSILQTRSTMGKSALISFGQREAQNSPSEVAKNRVGARVRRFIGVSHGTGPAP